ncbi:hypothetical protein BaRGS_00018617 [Batillaria attramentaria]|uniref:Uncharacterized protein n=1 Tax=Batillaria attramentaria TaxID=370345 RepID=A0ABD0KS07_9CAEN
MKESSAPSACAQLTEQPLHLIGDIFLEVVFLFALIDYLCISYAFFWSTNGRQLLPNVNKIWDRVISEQEEVGSMAYMSTGVIQNKKLAPDECYVVLAKKKVAGYQLPDLTTEAEFFIELECRQGVVLCLPLSSIPYPTTTLG